MTQNKRSKKVLIGVTVDHAVPYHFLLSEAFVDSGWEVHFVSSGGLNFENLDSRIHRHKVVMARQPNILQDLKSLSAWLRIIRDERPSLVIAGTPKASMLGIFASKLLGVPNRVYWVHGLRLETAGGKFFKFLLGVERFTSRNSTALVSVSTSLTSRLNALDIAPSEKISMIGAGSTQGVDLKHFRPSESADEKLVSQKEIGLIPDLYTIGFVGRLTIDKGVQEFAQALEVLSSKKLDFQILLVGEFEDPLSVEIIEGLEKRGIRIVKTGHVTDTSRYYRCMDVFCLPSYREGLPNVVLEAFASGIPVIGTDVTGISDLVSDNETGLLVPARNSAALEDALEEVVRDEALSAQLASNGLDYVTTYFDSKKIVASQLAFFEKLISE